MIDDHRTYLPFYDLNSWTACFYTFLMYTCTCIFNIELYREITFPGFPILLKKKGAINHLQQISRKSIIINILKTFMLIENMIIATDNTIITTVVVVVDLGIKMIFPNQNN